MMHAPVSAPAVTGFRVRRESFRGIDARRAIAIEPVDAPTDAFNREACAADIRLPPMASRTFSCGVDFLASPHRT